MHTFVHGGWGGGEREMHQLISCAHWKFSDSVKTCKGMLLDGSDLNDCVLSHLASQRKTK